MGLLSYPPHGPLDRINWVLPFWVDAKGQDALLGLPLFWGLVDGPANGAYFQTLSAAPQPLCTDCVGKGCNCSCVDCYFHVSVRINPGCCYKSNVNNDPLGFAPVFSFFDDLFGFELLWSPNFLFTWCFCVWLSSGFLFVYLAPGPFLECFFFHLVPGPAASPSLHAFLTGTTRS